MTISTRIEVRRLLPLWFGGFCAVVLLLPLMASAETVVRTGDSVSVAANQTVENDFYAAGGSLTHSGVVKGDLYALAGSVTVSGPVGSDLTVVGGTIQVHAPVADDVRIVGGDVVIAGDVKGDLFVLGGVLKVLSSAHIGGNVYFYGSEAELEGEVKGSVMGSARSLTVNSDVGGIDMTVMRLSLGDQAKVRGDVRYAGSSDIERAPGAVVDGEILAGPAAAPEKSGGRFALVFVLAWIFTSLSFFLLLRPQLIRALGLLVETPLSAGLIGLAAVFGLPILTFVLLATVLGAWIGVVALLLTLLVFILSFILMPALLGGYLVQLLRKRRELNALAVVVGVAALMLLAYIPYIGGLAIFAAFVLTLGAILHAAYRLLRE